MLYAVLMLVIAGQFGYIALLKSDNDALILIIRQKERSQFRYKSKPVERPGEKVG
jgi:hypothetical protein